MHILCGIESSVIFCDNYIETDKFLSPAPIAIQLVRSFYLLTYLLIRMELHAYVVQRSYTVASDANIFVNSFCQ